VEMNLRMWSQTLPPVKSKAKQLRVLMRSISSPIDRANWKPNR
jgi:hypothetical protein